MDEVPLIRLTLIQKPSSQLEVPPSLAGCFKGVSIFLYMLHITTYFTFLECNTQLDVDLFYGFKIRNYINFMLE